jgi:hypothetical protein
VLAHLETVPVAQDRDLEHFRFPVQYVIRPNLDYRGFAGEIASGVVKKGDTLVSLPSGRSSKVKAIDVYEGELEEAFTPQSVTIRLEDEIDVSRGDMLVHAHDLPHVRRTFDAYVVWMNETPLDREKSYLIKHTTQYVRAEVRDLHFKVDMGSLENVPAETLGLNDIGKVTLACRRAVYFDPYRQNRATGAFIIVDSLTNSTVGAGMIAGERGEASQGLDAALAELRAGSSMMPKTQVSPRERLERLGQKGATVWLTGLAGLGPLDAGLRHRACALRSGPRRHRGGSHRRVARDHDHGVQGLHGRGPGHRLRLPGVHAGRPRALASPHRRRPRGAGVRGHRPRALQAAPPRGGLRGLHAARRTPTWPWASTRCASTRPSSW